MYQRRNPGSCHHAQRLGSARNSQRRVTDEAFKLHRSHWDATGSCLVSSSPERTSSVYLPHPIFPVLSTIAAVRPYITVQRGAKWGLTSNDTPARGRRGG